MVLSCLLGLLFLTGSHPMMGVTLLIFIALLYFIYIFMMASVLWFGLVMVLVILSGVLVLFTYMASLSPNERFEFNMFSVGFLFVLFLGWGGSVGGKGQDLSLFTLQLWSSSMLGMNLFMLGVLLVVMLIVMKVTGKFLGALRVE